MHNKLTIQQIAKFLDALLFDCSKPGVIDLSFIGCFTAIANHKCKLHLLQRRDTSEIGERINCN